MVPTKVDMDKRLKNLLNSAPILIFMKGEPTVGSPVKQSEIYISVLKKCKVIRTWTMISW